MIITFQIPNKYHLAYYICLYLQKYCGVVRVHAALCIWIIPDHLPCNPIFILVFHIN